MYYSLKIEGEILLLPNMSSLIYRQDCRGKIIKIQERPNIPCAQTPDIGKSIILLNDKLQDI